MRLRCTSDVRATIRADCLAESFLFSDAELRERLRAAKRLVLAAQDMGEARAAASELVDRPGRGSSVWKAASRVRTR